MWLVQNKTCFAVTKCLRGVDKRMAHFSAGTIAPIVFVGALLALQATGAAPLQRYTDGFRDPSPQLCACIHTLHTLPALNTNVCGCRHLLQTPTSAIPECDGHRCTGHSRKLAVSFLLPYCRSTSLSLPTLYGMLTWRHLCRRTVGSML